ncbi:acetyltransferase [Brochothrix thermosphacta]|uniref:acetyltransferase n=1 Tax=Brochothrix thermosphacta TaxID=2756 RepID=UPI000A1B3B8D|nr:acetyltransferase [Brochothrix thermosphacta]SLN00148.1 Galactoside O-acetyltransferase [Brachybacterium faecium]SPN71253.1 putative O-acetyltransferase involved in biofilm matrix formation epsM [Brochothrix thermosphacta]
MGKIKQLIIIGNGGHSRVVQSIIKQTNSYQLLEIWDDNYEEEIIDVGIRYKPIPKKNVASADSVCYFIAIGDNLIRSKIANQLQLSTADYATIIHPQAIVDKQAIVKTGSLIMANAVVQTNSIIGHHSIVNTSAVVEHDTMIGDFVHVAPNVTLTGNCHLSKHVFIGAGSVLIPNISIGEHTVIGAGSVVIRSIPSNVTAYGNPARIV